MLKQKLFFVVVKDVTDFVEGSHIHVSHSSCIHLINDMESCFIVIL